MLKSTNNIEYICTWCGKRITKRATSGRPEPGQCPRKPKTKDGMGKPHTWRINRKF